MQATWFPQWIFLQLRKCAMLKTIFIQLSSFCNASVMYSMLSVLWKTEDYIKPIRKWMLLTLMKIKDWHIRTHKHPHTLTHIHTLTYTHTHTLTCTHTQTPFNGHFPGEPELTSWPLDTPSHLFLNCASFWDRHTGTIFPSHPTIQSHQVFFEHPLCLIPSISNVIQHFTQSISPLCFIQHVQTISIYTVFQ